MMEVLFFALGPVALSLLLWALCRAYEHDVNTMDALEQNTVILERLERYCQRDDGEGRLAE